MARRSSWLVVGVIAAIALAAATDALRGGGEATPPSATTTERAASTASETGLAWRPEPAQDALAGADEARRWLAGVRATGRLFLTEPSCRLRALRLPDLVWEPERPAPSPAPCRFTLAPDETAWVEGIAVQPQGNAAAICRDGVVDVLGSQGSLRTRVRDACAPTWTPDGRLTFVRDGELWLGASGGRPLITRAELRDMFGQEAALAEVAWLDDERVWAAVRLGDGLTLAAMTLSDLVYSPTFTARRIDGVRVSSTGMVAARTDSGVVLFDNGGRRALSFPGATAVAWAPGSLVAAVAAPREILFVAPVSREVVPLGVEAADLEWVVP